MGTYDTFIDEERNRIAQTKALQNIMLEYYHDYETSDVVSNPAVKYRTYYIQTLTPCYFIRIEGKMFTGIVSVREDEIFRYPKLTYGGDELRLTSTEYEALGIMADLAEIVEAQADHLPMRQLRNKYINLEFFPNIRISGEKYDLIYR